jgi:acyl transferase domain-containing protein
MYVGLGKGGFLSNTGSCKTFDNGADGYCRGEAVGVVVLKRLSDALKDNDNIKGIIKSVETNHSAHAISITHPHSGAQQELYRRTLDKAKISPTQVGYVEMHGTGTQAGDNVEGHSVAEYFGKDRTPGNPLYVGSVKSSIGHGEAVSNIKPL